ncbi:ATP-binding protein [Streptomyces graminifolii]|uniref:ATP-binding protein n=1 Tax=Streptomyces graminifolii TaxID=1266771 RepID=UPI0040590A6E
MPHPTPLPAGPPMPTAGSAPTGADVVLYTTSINSRVAAVTLAALAEFAAQQGWTVLHEAYDLAPLHVPARVRAGWSSVAHLLTTGTVTGLVVPAEHEIARTSSEQIALRRWLQEIGAFAAYPHARRHGPPAFDDRLAGPGSPVDREWSRSYALTPASLRRVRGDARTFLTVLGWPGDIATALEVLSRLALNAVVHAQPTTDIEPEMTVRLAITEDDVLLVDVEDPRPEFPGSEAAIAGELGSGLMYVRMLDATVTWFLAEDACTKTVRAVLLGEVPN